MHRQRGARAQLKGFLPMVQALFGAVHQKVRKLCLHCAPELLQALERRK